ncbi:geranylgeranyl pyrophosphate synthase [Virgisporangium aliadipatigenens]|uniref:Geranylgeranyl pyrophosphate synthase n=1 Tax=Virgisporangium aliadipatigenens TaxID=741659 RepID=A0A8J3YPB8_9ACTN|nr:polyprenyl synthetase family protein [Virgisporangium aliadipatigenens]GIJ48916.1 geranylgeranyl pyrophosphate synthase [Virgisporangium aliadipatigenens]
MWTVADEELSDWLAERRAATEELLRSTVDGSGEVLLDTVAGHLIAAGGKRMRPALALLAARFGPEPDGRRVLEAAALVELVHVASLYHDDVLDNADRRRGAPSANARWGDRLAVLGGDYLVAKAAILGAGLGPQAQRAQAETLARLVRGQVSEAAGPAPGQDPEQHYLAVVSDKTAALFGLAAHLGALAAGATPAATAALTRYAEQLGIAFQLADDVLDIAADRAASGKPDGADLRQGLRTLPVLRALRGTGERGPRARLRRAVMAGVVAGATGSRGVHRAALTLLRRSPGLSEGRAEAERYAARATADLGVLPEGPARAALAALADTVVGQVGTASTRAA